MDFSPVTRFRRSSHVAAAAMENANATEGESDSSSIDLDAEPASMAGKGIKRLCCELVELKEASDEDFKRNVYLAYPVFVRICEEVGSVRSEIMELKQHVSTQEQLVKILLDKVNSDIVSDQCIDSKNEEFKVLNIYSPERYNTQMYNVLDSLDVLISEHRDEEALAQLETESKNLEKLYMEAQGSAMITSYMSALSKRRTLLADQVAAVAEHPRVTAPELQKSLSQLCILGDNDRAHYMLVKHYHTQIARSINDLESLKVKQETDVREVVRVIFSTVSQAVRSSNRLHGEGSPYSFEVIRWAKVEIEAFICEFHKYVKSISAISGGLLMAVEAVKTALSYSFLLEHEKLALHLDLAKLIRPSMEEVLQLQVNRLKKVISAHVATDTLVLGKFLVSGILRDHFSMRTHGKLEYCLLTSSGRKFVTLMQEFLNDISQLMTLEMEFSIVEGLANLFNTYIFDLEMAITRQETSINHDFPTIRSAQKFRQHFAGLISSSTLLHLLPTIVVNILKVHSRSSNEEVPTKHSPWEELDSWVPSIQEAVDRLRANFCQQLVCEALSHRQTHLEADWNSLSRERSLPSLTEGPMPSFPFQVIFLQLRQVEELSKSVSDSEWDVVDKLLADIITTVIALLAIEPEFWKDTEDGLLGQRRSSYRQFQLDKHFLLEVARYGRDYSDEVMDRISGSIAKLEPTFTATDSDLNGCHTIEKWAMDAAKLAINRLLEADMVDPEDKDEMRGSSIGEAKLHKNSRSNTSNIDYITLISNSESLNDCESKICIAPGAMESGNTEHEPLEGLWSSKMLAETKSEESELVELNTNTNCFDYDDVGFLISDMSLEGSLVNDDKCDAPKPVAETYWLSNDENVKVGRESITVTTEADSNTDRLIERPEFISKAINRLKLHEPETDRSDATQADSDTDSPSYVQNIRAGPAVIRETTHTPNLHELEAADLENLADYKLLKDSSKMNASTTYLTGSYNLSNTQNLYASYPNSPLTILKEDPDSADLENTADSESLENTCKTDVPTPYTTCSEENTGNSEDYGRVGGTSSDSDEGSSIRLLGESYVILESVKDRKASEYVQGEQQDSANNRLCIDRESDELIGNRSKKVHSEGPSSVNAGEHSLHSKQSTLLTRPPWR